jgi:hypothetical protein
MNFLQWKLKGSKKGKKDKKAKFQAVFAFLVLFAFFASALPGAAKPDVENAGPISPQRPRSNKQT